MKDENIKTLEESYSIKVKDLKFCDVFIFNEKKYILESLGENECWVYDADNKLDHVGSNLKIEENEIVEVVGRFIL